MKNETHPPTPLKEKGKCRFVAYEGEQKFVFNDLLGDFVHVILKYLSSPSDGNRTTICPHILKTFPKCSSVAFKAARRAAPCPRALQYPCWSSLTTPCSLQRGG